MTYNVFGGIQTLLNLNFPRNHVYVMQLAVLVSFVYTSPVWGRSHEYLRWVTLNGENVSWLALTSVRTISAVSLCVVSPCCCISEDTLQTLDNEMELMDRSVLFKSIIIVTSERRLCNARRLSVCLSVCLSVWDTWQRDGVYWVINAVEVDYYCYICKKVM